MLHRRPRAAAPALAILLLAVAPPGAAQQVFVDSLFAVHRTPAIVYGSAPIAHPPGEVELLLDLYEPVGDSAPPVRPAFIIVHGGGFTGGSRNQGVLVELARQMAARGYVTVSIDYRLMGQEPVISNEFLPLLAAIEATGNPLAGGMAAAAEDATRAHRWLMENAVPLAIDGGRVAIGGGSAGSITALLVAYTLDDHAVTDLPVVGAVMDLWGALWELSADMEHGEAPLIIIHGTEDPVVPFVLAEELVAQAGAAGIPYEFHPIEGAGHGFGEINIFEVEVEPGVTLFDRIVAFFYDQLGLAGVPAAAAAVPGRPAAGYRLLPNRPNPFNPATTIRFELPAHEPVRIELFDATGRRVRRLVQGAGFAAGDHAVQWDGRNEHGVRVASGVYVCRIEAGAWSASQSIVIVR